MNDDELTRLIADDLHRDAVCRRVERGVMKELRRQRRRRLWHMVALAFGAPALLLAYCLGVWAAMPPEGLSREGMLLVIAPGAILLAAVAWIVNTISEKVIFRGARCNNQPARLSSR